MTSTTETIRACNHFVEMNGSFEAAIKHLSDAAMQYTIEERPGMAEASLRFIKDYKKFIELTKDQSQYLHQQLSLAMEFIATYYDKRNKWMKAIKYYKEMTFHCRVQKHQIWWRLGGLIASKLEQNANNSYWALICFETAKNMNNNGNYRAAAYSQRTVWKALSNKNK